MSVASGRIPALALWKAADGLQLSFWTLGCRASAYPLFTLQ